MSWYYSLWPPGRAAAHAEAASLEHVTVFRVEGSQSRWFPGGQIPVFAAQGE